MNSLISLMGATNAPAGFIESKMRASQNPSDFVEEVLMGLR